MANDLTTQDFFTAITGRKTALINFLGDEKNALRFTSSVMQCVQQNPKLLECNKQSLIGAFLECAAVGLFPSTWSGQCWIIPYASKNGLMAQFQMGYKGFVTLAYEAGVKKIWAEIIYENDEFEEYKGSDPRIIHKPAPVDQRGRAIGVYCCAEKDGTIWHKVMYESEIFKIKKLSKAANSPSSPWNSDTDPELWMWKKTALKQLIKLLPFSKNSIQNIERAVHSDNVTERGGYFASENQMVEGTITAPDLPDVQQYLDKIDSLSNKEELEDFKAVFARVAHEYPREDRESVQKKIIEKEKNILKNKSTPAQEDSKKNLELELKDIQDAIGNIDEKHPEYAKMKDRIDEIKKQLAS